MHYRKIWELHHNKKIPEGYEIHHIDGDNSNNDLSNLLCVSLDEHLEIHTQQKDWGAVQAILMRKEQRDGISDAASKFQKDLMKENRHNFQMMTEERRIEISKGVIDKRLSEGNPAYLGIEDPVENARRGGKKAAELKAGFLDTDSDFHGSKYVKGSFWWINEDTGERKRSKECPGNGWKRGMK